MSPDYFWRMPPREAWWFTRAHTPQLMTAPTEAERWQPLYDLLEP